MRANIREVGMPSGTVKYVNADRGFGIISRDDKQPKVFLHISEVNKAGLDTIEKGQRWHFDVEDRGGSSPAAVNLRLEEPTAKY
ncbi:cold-shock protein [Reyranella sp.]|uniref:cold-shock protein n=1 Tax=Reyranella sp. TaxID=1929291 RepID=UPI00351F24C4